MAGADERRPAVRARSAQDWIAYLEERYAEAAPEVVAAIPPDSRRLILETPRTAWIDFEHDRWLPKATVDVLGEEAAVAAWAAFLPSHLEAPLFRTLVNSMVRLFGFSPTTFVRLLPRAWGQAYRDCCDVEVGEHGEGFARAAFVNVHPDVIAWPSYPTSWRGVLTGAFAVTRTEGTLEMNVDEAACRIDARWSW